MRRLLPTVVAGLLLAAVPAWGQVVEGRLFEDRDGDALPGPADPPLQGVSVGLFGRTEGGLPVDLSVQSAGDGTFGFTPGDGCYLVGVEEPAGWRLAPARWDRLPAGSPGYLFPVGLPRFSSLAWGVSNLQAGALLYAAMGDSIAWNFNVCGYPESFWYSRQLRSRLACAAPGASVTLTQAAVKGEHTDDLLVDDSDDFNNVFRILEIAPELITLSMIGNDLLDVDVTGTPTQAEMNRAVQEILDSRRNLQEALSVLVSELPSADIALNSLYDNLAYSCGSPATSPLHREWVPIMNQMLRDLAWGQARRVATIEVAADFGLEGLDGSCTGFAGLICRDLFGFDRIHPDNDGYNVVREKLWEAAGGVTLGAGDVLGRTEQSGIDLGLLRRVRRLHPRAFDLLNGVLVTDPEAALGGGDGAGASITLGAGAQEFRVGGFPDWYDEIEIVKVVAGVRYRTTGTVQDDFYRIEASVTGQFDPGAGYDYTTTNWNTYTPLVGGGGPNAPALNPDYPAARILALPDVPAYREVSSTLTKDPVEIPGSPDYEWPPLTHDDLATSAIRVVAAPVAGTGGNDAYAVVLDEAWLDLYGWEKPRPPEVGGLEIGRLPDGTVEIAFDEVAGADRYNVYAGRLDGLASGYDHGLGAPAGPFCDAPHADAGGGRRSVSLDPGVQAPGSVYYLVTAHVQDVESPGGTDSAGVEVDRSQAICR